MAEYTTTATSTSTGTVYVTSYPTGTAATSYTISNDTTAWNNTITTDTYTYSNIIGSGVTIGGREVATEDDLDPIREELDRMKPLKEKNKKEKESKNMNLKFGHLNFGPLTNFNGVRLSPYGIAIQNRDERWVSFNAKEGALVDVEGFVMDAKNMLYRIPVAIKNVEIGDTIIHNSIPMFVTEVFPEAGKFNAINPYAGEEVSILPTKNMFGFDYVTKIISLLDLNGKEPSEDNPFGDMLPLLMAGNEDFNPMMFLLMNKDKDMDQKTLMMLAMCGGGSNENMLPLLMLLNK